MISFSSYIVNLQMLNRMALNYIIVLHATRWKWLCLMLHQALCKIRVVTLVSNLYILMLENLIT